MTEEHLTDGWEPDAPVSDTLLRRFVFNLAAFNKETARSASAPCSWPPGWPASHSG